MNEKILFMKGLQNQGRLFYFFLSDGKIMAYMLFMHDFLCSGEINFAPIDYLNGNSISWVADVEQRRFSFGSSNNSDHAENVPENRDHVILQQQNISCCGNNNATKCLLLTRYY